MEERYYRYYHDELMLRKIENGILESALILIQVLLHIFGRYSQIIPDG
jgi:hypothetical protein